MKIALDYDGTYTSDPAMWDRFIRLAKDFGHEVICVTQRYADDPEECVPDLGCPVIYTDRQLKGRVMAETLQMPDIWIDDMPQRIFG